MAIRKNHKIQLKVDFKSQIWETAWKVPLRIFKKTKINEIRALWYSFWLSRKHINRGFLKTRKSSKIGVCIQIGATYSPRLKTHWHIMTMAQLIEWPFLYDGGEFLDFYSIYCKLSRPVRLPPRRHHNHSLLIWSKKIILLDLWLTFNSTCSK